MFRRQHGSARDASGHTRPVHMPASDRTLELRQPSADLDALTDRMDVIFATQAALNDLCIDAIESLHALSRALELGLQHGDLEVADLAGHVAKEQASLHFLLRDLTNRLDHLESSVTDDAN
jgi:hypothetical protein